MAIPVYSASGTAVAETSNWPLNGTSRFFDFGTISDLTPSATTAFTAVAWIKTTSADGCIFSRQDTGSAVLRGWSLMVVGGKLYGGIVNDHTGPVVAVEATTTNSVNDGIEHEVALMYDGSTDLAGFTLAIDGVSQSFGSSTDNLTAGQPTNATANVNIGARNAADFLGGSVRFVSFFNKKLSLAELAETRARGVTTNLLATSVSSNLKFWAKINQADEPQSNGMLDSSGNAHHGTPNFNGITVAWPTHAAGELGLLTVETSGNSVTARSGQGITSIIDAANGSRDWRFSGSNIATMGDVLDVDPADAWTLGIWIDATAFNGGEPIRKYDVNGRGYALQLTAGSKVRLYLGTAFAGTAGIDVDSNASLVAGKNFITVGIDGSGVAAGVRIHINGALQATTTNHDLLAGGPTTNAQTLQIGVFSNTSVVSHAAKWNVRLTTAQVQEAYNGGVPPDLNSLATAPDPVGWWIFDENDTADIAGGIADHSGTNPATVGGGLLPSDPVRLQVLHKIAVSSSDSPVRLILPDVNDHLFAKITTFSGTDQTSPINAGTFAIFGPGSTTANCSSITTTVNDCLAVMCFAATDQRTLNAITNGALASIVERSDENTALGNDSSLAIVTAQKATAGAFGTSTGTWSSATTTATAILALMPPQMLGASGPYELPEPDQIGYTNDISNGVFEVPLKGGLSRRRQDIYFAGHTVNVTWILKDTEYTSLMGYFLTDLKYASQPFLLDLVVDIGLPTTHKCRTIGGMPKLTQQKGQAYWVSATLQCENNPTYTGLITYQEPNRIVFSTENPFLYALINPIEVGDSIRIISSKGIHPTGSTPLNLDGIYEVAGHVGFNVLTLTSPELVNSDWTTLFGLAGTAQYGDVSHGNVISTVTRVPTL